MPPLVNGETANAGQPFDCRPIDLDALYQQLDASNDNALIPLTDKGRNPLGGADGRELTIKPNDGLTLPRAPTC